MSRSTVVTAITALSLYFSSTATGNNITYALTNLSGVNYDISGNITTDGVIGTLISDDIVAWDYTVTSKSDQTIVQMESSITSGSGVFLVGTIVASFDQIEILPPPIPNDPYGVTISNVELGAADGSFYSVSSNSTGVARPPLGARVKVQRSAYGDYVLNHAIPTDNLIYAARNVPEPSSLVLALIALGGLALTGRSN
jgi:hypothetical protein